MDTQTHTHVPSSFVDVSNTRIPATVQVLTAVMMKIHFFWEMTPCRLAVSDISEKQFLDKTFSLCCNYTVMRP